MMRKEFATLLFTICSVGAVAQASTEAAGTEPSKTASTAAYVYVARPTHLDAFAAAANGTLTPVPGAPFANLDLVSLVATKKFLIAVDADGTDLHTFAIASNGAVKEVSTLNVGKFVKSICGYPYETQLSTNTTGSDVYFTAADCNGLGHLLSFRLESSGELEFLGASNYEIPYNDASLTTATFLSNDEFAYQLGSSFTGGSDDAQPQLTRYKRASSGLLEFQATDDSPVPATPPTTGGKYFPVAAATAPSDRLAVALADLDDTGNYTGNTVLAVYSTDSHGNLSTKSTYENMPVVPDSYITQAISISPSGKYLALAGDGVQIYHFNGSSPITHFAAVKPGVNFDQVAWDGQDHVYAHDAEDSLVYVYTVSTSGLKEASGSPYSIPESSAMAVLAK